MLKIKEYIPQIFQKITQILILNRIFFQVEMDVIILQSKKYQHYQEK